MEARILIVDDELPIQRLINRYLEGTGYICQTCGSVQEAKQALLASSFDLLLSDLNMPGESGIQLLKYAKEHYPQMGRVVISGLGSTEIAGEVMKIGVYGYIIKPISKNTLLITVENSLRHLLLDLNMRVSKKELQMEVSHRSETLSAIMNNLNVGVVMIDKEMMIVEMNQKMNNWFPDASPGKKIHCFSAFRFPPENEVCVDCTMQRTFSTGKTCEKTAKIYTKEGERDLRIVTSPITDSSGLIYAGIALYEDVTEKLLLERDLRQAQKLEAIGQLATGIAHEINTPIQYIGDNISFLKSSFEDTDKVLKTYERLWQKIEKGAAITSDMSQELADCLDDADMEYLCDEIPTTISQSLDGVQRVDQIVKAMKDFSHPGSDKKENWNINKIVESTITVCKNEWKYVAEVVTDLASDLPVVPCFSSELSQVFLNIIVNGAHAIGDVTDGGKKGMGKISISTTTVNDRVVIRITDTGGGIPREIQDRVFDPFFTTKERGKGTGQGLAIAHSVVVDKHQGKLFLETEEGIGTTFVIEIPA